MEFTVELLNYGRHGTVAVEPRTGLRACGADESEARTEMEWLLRDHAAGHYVPPAGEPVRSLITIRI